MIQINCDIGEKGPLHPEDCRLMNFIHIANLACDGHAGDKETVDSFRTLAQASGVGVSAHLSYPDKANFGRASMDIAEADLLASLDKQLALLPGARMVKFHGALYNDACRDSRLADLLAGWLMRSGIGTILAPADSELAGAARRLGITVLREAFVDRRYAWDPERGHLRLANRKHGGVITDAAEGLRQAEDIILRGRVNAGTAAAPDWHEIKADTVCIHSDTPIALELATKLRAALEGYEKAARAAGVKGNIRLVKQGFCGTAGLPVFGRQHIGVSPGGAMDCFSLRRGNLMLGNPEGSPALEIVGPPEIEFLSAGRFVLTGGRLDAVLRRGDVQTDLEHSRVYEAEAGDRLAFGARRYGVYTYFCFRGREGGGAAPAEAVPYSAVSGWADPSGRIRVLPGPEMQYLAQPGLFFLTPWHTTFKMDKMGIRLEGDAALACSIKGNMISGAVADGTVQLTPTGPIVLLRHRQTTGGYPRIFNVISADIDLLGQFAPNQQIHFVQTNLDHARDYARQKEEALDKLRQ